MSNKTRCESCGKDAASHDVVHFGTEGKYEILCGGCFNRRAAAMMGVEYEHAEFHPVTVTDCYIQEFLDSGRVIVDRAAGSPG